VKACINLLGVPAREIAVFYRLNDMSRPVEQALSRLQVPYKVFGGMSFYDRAEIRDTISMLRVIANPKDSAAFSRVVNRPKRGIGEKALGLIENYAHMKGIDLISACGQAEEIFGDTATADAAKNVHYCFRIDPNRQSVADCLAEAVSRTGYIAHLESHEKEEPTKIEERKRNVQELVNSIALWCQDEQSAGHAGSIGDYLGYISLLTSLDDKRGDDAVRLMSLHASKGLEFDVVFMVGVENNLLPHKKAITDRAEAGTNEERRLCYVGFTRARKQLFVSYCQQRQSAFSRGKGVKFDAVRPSPFLLEAGLINEMDYLRKAPRSIVS
jgi:DNA helicase-2/ATP-dependent DNA helicase PcrA